jgi:hypothetical protein
LSFFYEEAASVVERRALDSVGSVISRTEAAQGWSRSTLGFQPTLSGRHSLGPAYGCAMAGFAGGIPRWVHLLATAADVGRTRRLAKGVAQTAGPVRRTQATGLGRSLSGCDFRHRQKRGLAVGTTRRGKATKCVVVVDGRGVPVGAQLASGADFRTPACRKHARYGEGAAPWPWTPPFPSATRDCRSRI